MRRRFSSLVPFACATIAAFAVLPASGARAQSLVDPPEGRFQMQPVEGGIARLDTRTGAIELCRVEGDAIDCSGRRTTGGGGERARIAGAPEEDGAADAQAGEPEGASRAAGDLQARIEALEDRVSALEDRLDGPLIDPKTSDLAMERMRQFFRGFADMARELDDELSDREPPQEGPQRDQPMPDPTMPDPAMPGRT